MLRALTIASLTFVPLQGYAVETLGEWAALLRGSCLQIERVEAGYIEVYKSCPANGKDPIRSPLIKIGPKSFRLDERPKPKWHYQITASGQLEVRDSEGVVNTLNRVTHAPQYESKRDDLDSPKTIGLSCYQLGYRYAYVAVRTIRNLSIDPNWDFSTPKRCRDKQDTVEGIKAGTKAGAQS